jgi:hypothetical protein
VSSASPPDSITPRPTWADRRPRISLGVLAAVLGIVALFLCLSVLAPPTMDAQALTWEEGIIAGGSTGAMVGTFVPIPGIGTMSGLIVGATVGFVASFIWPDPSGKEAEQARASAMAAWYAGELYNATYDEMELARTNAGNVAELGERTTLYYERSAYNAAKKLYENQTANGQAHFYDADYILENSAVSSEVTAEVWGVYQTYNTVLSQMDHIGSNFVGDYSSMSYRAVLQAPSMGTYVEKSTFAGTYDHDKYVRIMSYVNTAPGTYVWLPEKQTIYIWSSALTEVSGPVTITGHDGTVYYNEDVTLAPGAGIGINLQDFGITSGRYNIHLPSPKMFCNAIAAEDYSNSGIVAPGIAIYQQSGETLKFVGGWASLPADKGFRTAGTWTFNPESGKVWAEIKLAYPYLSYAWSGGETPQYSLDKVMKTIWDTSETSRKVIYAASNSGQAFYNVLLGSGGNTLAPPVDIISPDTAQTENMTWQQKYATYLAYMNALNDTFQTSNALGPDNLNITTGSFDLLIRGNVYDPEGNKKVSNQIFSYFSYLNGCTLTAGQNMTIHDPGYIIVWGEGATIGQWNGEKNSANNCTYFDVGEGWVIETTEMTFKEKQVTTHTLEIDPLKVYVPEGLHASSTPPPADYWTDPEWIAAHWYIFALITGVILAALAGWTEHTTLAILGILIALVSGAAWYFALNPVHLSPFSISIQDAVRNWIMRLG